MSKINNLTKGGIFTALTLICIYLSSIVTTNKLFLLGAASCIIPLSILTTDIKNSIIVYGASSLLSFILVPRGAALAYLLFFGSYGFIKYYVERLRKLPIEIFLKLAFFNTCFYVVLKLYSLLFTGMFKINIPIYYMVIMLQVIFLIYDYALTVFIAYVNTRILKKTI